MLLMKIKYFIKNHDVLDKTLAGMDEEANKLVAENQRLRDALKESKGKLESMQHNWYDENIADAYDVMQEALKDTP